MTTSNARNASSNGETTQVLHVDDEPQFCELVSTYLERLNDSLTVVSETDAQDGLERLESARIDCVISDYKMPGADGIEFLDQVRERYPNLPFVLFTGEGSERVASEAINAGVTSYLQKGGSESYEQLANRIENAIGRRQSERRAEITSERLLQLYEQTDGFYILDTDWTITYWNQQIAERTGLSTEEVLHENYWEVFPDAAETEVYDHFQTVLATDEPHEFEIYYDPLEYWAEVRAYPVDDGLFVHSREITAKKEREDELEKRNQILQSFASTVSHDLRNPLNVAEGKLQLAQRTGDFEHLEEVAQAHNRMQNLIDELLRLSKGEELDLTSVSLRTVSTTAWETITSGATDLVVEDDRQFEAHEGQLRRLIENLCWNAIEHGDATTVRIGWLPEGGVFVEDDGTGIPLHEHDRVFESGHSTVDGNPGFGLAIVEGITETHGWDIELVGNDGGARFEIRGIERGSRRECSPS